MQTSRVIAYALILLVPLGGCDHEFPPQSSIRPTTLLARSVSPLPADTAHPNAATPANDTPAPSPPPIATSAPTPLPSPIPDPWADYALAMRAGFSGDVAANAGLPRYDLRMWLATGTGTLTGTEQIVLPNGAGAPLNDVALRLYPNFPPDVFGKGGDVRMAVIGAAVDRHAVEIRYAAQDTAVLLALPEPLAPGASATLAVTFTATIQPWRDRTWPLPSYYPMLAVRDGARWRTDITRFADRVYAESAFYAAEISAPTGLSVIGSGSTIATQDHGDGSTTHSIRSGPVREFALAIGDFVAAREQAGANGDVALNVYAARGSRLDAKAIAGVAAGALADFDARFGAYPYRELDIQLLPYDFDGGDEYPGLVLLYSGGPVDAGTRYVAAHEVAHQWWYAVVGNGIYRQPWLDEALAQYSGILYDEDVAGAASAAADWEREVLRRYRGALSDGDLAVGLGITDYPNFNVYYRTVYGKGPIFLRTLREQLGDQAFFDALKLYYQRHRYRVATTRDLQRACEAASSQDLSALFQKWVGGPGL